MCIRAASGGCGARESPRWTRIRIEFRVDNIAPHSEKPEQARRLNVADGFAQVNEMGSLRSRARHDDGTPQQTAEFSEERRADLAVLETRMTGPKADDELHTVAGVRRVRTRVTGPVVCGSRCRYGGPAREQKACD
jgi:hypothetical protein